MLKEYTTFFRRLMILTDFCLVTASFFLAYELRGKIDAAYSLKEYIIFLPFLLIAWNASLYFFGMYYSFRTTAFPDVLYIICKASVVAFILLSSFVYLSRLQYINITFLMLIFIFAFALIAIEKTALKLFFVYIRKKGFNFRRILIVGTEKRAQVFIDLIHQHPDWGFRIIGLIDEEAAKKGQVVNGYPVIGSFTDVAEIIKNNVIDEIVFIVPRSCLSKIEGLLYLCETQGIKTRIAADYFESKLSKLKLTELYGLPFLTFDSSPDRIWHILMKRAFDILFSGLALLFLSPLLLILTIIIKLNSPGPVIFRQSRIGLNGRRFTLYKFRTMVQDAEKKLNDIIPHNEMQGPVFKMADDPRLTGVGKFLRKFSLDEIPQFWNVFKADMSLVGPRPPLPAEVKEYDAWHRRRLSMRPGMTCLWQTCGRNKITDFNRWVKLDLEYIDKWSLWLDFKIMLNTIPVMLFGIGAK